MKPQVIDQPKRLYLPILGLLLGIILVCLAGCSISDGVPRAMEADYGRSYTSARMEMMLHPPDVVDATPPLGMSPQTAKNIQERYDKSFKEKEEPPTVRWLFK